MFSVDIRHDVSRFFEKLLDFVSLLVSAIGVHLVEEGICVEEFGVFLEEYCCLVSVFQAWLSLVNVVYR
jgi:hypothetical protein